MATVEVTAQVSSAASIASVSTASGRSLPDQPISVEAWTTPTDQLINASQTPILFYVEVKQGQTAVLDAQVTVVIQPPNGSQPIRIQLYDRGTGG